MSDICSFCGKPANVRYKGVHACPAHVNNLPTDEDEAHEDHRLRLALEIMSGFMLSPDEWHFMGMAGDNIDTAKRKAIAIVHAALARRS